MFEKYQDLFGKQYDEITCELIDIYDEIESSIYKIKQIIAFRCYDEFLTCIVPDTDSYIGFEELYMIYIEWHKNRFDIKPLTKKDFRIKLCNDHNLEFKKNKLCGYSLVYSDDENN